jgi:hypothetical protein
MGRAIFYCFQCSKRVSDSDLDAGKAFRIGERILCGACAPPGTSPTPSSKKIQIPPPRKSGSTSVVLRSVVAPLATPPPQRPPEKRPNRLVLRAGAAGAAVLVVIVALFFVFRRGAPPPVQEPAPIVKGPEKPSVPPPITKAPEGKESASRADLEKARTFAKNNPEDFSGQQREFTDVVWKWEGTEAARDAAKEAAAVKAAILEKVAAWMADLEAQIKGMLEAKDYEAAERKIEDLKKAHPLPEWRLAAEKRASEIFSLGKAGGKKPDPTLPETKTKPPSEEARKYLARWEIAAAKATARDFGGAIAELEQSAAALQEAEVRQDLDSDLALLRKIAAVQKEARDYLAQRPRGSGISLDFRDGKGGVSRISGTILQIDGERVEVRSGKTSEFVEWTDLTAATVAEIAQRGKFEPAVLAALCLLEGEVEPAKTFEAELPPRWSTYAAGARARIPKPDPAEKNARDLYAAAEKSYRSMDTLAAAVENYRTLRADFSSSALVQKYSDRIFRRSDAGRDYYYPPSTFRVEGTIQLAKNGKLESVKDSDDRDTLLNSAEVEFAVLPGLTYRCWVQVGACCEETFLFYYQGTEVTETDPKTRKKIACEPGTSTAAPVKHSIRNLKKTHEEHKVKGAKVHPKTASRWEWIEIVLPKYAGPGAKKLKFMTNQAGFSIGGASVSSTRKAPPPEAEIKDLEKARLLDEPPLLIDPDLLGWWTFDDDSGDQVTDVTGRNHTGKLVGAVQRAAGKIGGGIQIDGGQSGVQVADAEDLRISGSMTLALWVRRTAESSDWVCLLGRGTPEQRNYGLWLEPATRKILFQQYGGAGNFQFFAKKLFEDGQWVHLAVTMDASTVRLYYNGQLDTQEARGPAPFTSPGPLGIGNALYHTGLKGLMDDVRIYRRALTEDEIRGLVQSGR